MVLEAPQGKVCLHPRNLDGREGLSGSRPGSEPASSLRWPLNNAKKKKKKKKQQLLLLCGEFVTMSSQDSEPSVVQEAFPEKFHDSIPSPATRLFNRHRSIHQILGGGIHADIFLWRDKFMSAGILGGATVAYLLFEHSGYTLLKIIANLLLVSFAVLFVWSNAAVFLNRSPPPLPNLQISEEAATSLALALRVEINKVVAVGYDIALGKDFKTFLKVVAVLWGLSIVGGWFHFLTLVYLCFVLAHTIPVIYERYEDQIESYAKVAFEEAHKRYRKADAALLSKFPWFSSKVKKV